MKKYDVELKKSIGETTFGCTRDEARRAFGKKYQEIKKNNFSENTMDAYKDFHVFYSKENQLEAVEFFGKVKILINGIVVFPGTVQNVREFLPGLENDGYGWTDYENSVGITVSQDDENVIDAILFGCEGYYSE